MTSRAADAKSDEPTIAAVVRQQTGVAWSRARGLCIEGRVTPILRSAASITSHLFFRRITIMTLTITHGAFSGM